MLSEVRLIGLDARHPRCRSCTLLIDVHMCAAYRISHRLGMLFHVLMNRNLLHHPGTSVNYWLLSRLSEFHGLFRKRVQIGFCGRAIDGVTFDRDALLP